MTKVNPFSSTTLAVNQATGEPDQHSYTHTKDMQTARKFPTMKPDARPPPYERSGVGEQRVQPNTTTASGSLTYSVSDSPASVKGALDFTQRIERKLAEYNASQNVFKRWLFEIVSWLISAICMGAIIGIYIWLKDKPMSRVGQLLTYANILGKVASAALIVPTSEALGQLKWNWFHESKAMWDFEIFDKASRGPMGALMLLFRTKGRSLAALGAILIVLLLAIDTFFQQVVALPDRYALQNMTATIPRVSLYTPFYTPEFFQGYETSLQDPSLRPVVSQFFVDNGTKPIHFGNGTRPEIPLTCPTSDCTWPEYETLAICSECMDVSNLLDYACLNTTVDWSAKHTGPLNVTALSIKRVCGYFLNATSDAPVLMTGYIFEGTEEEPIVGESLLMRTLPLTDMIDRTPYYGGSINFRGVRNPILNALIASSANGTESLIKKDAPNMHECMLSWCVQTIKSSYVWGAYRENITSIYLNATGGPFPWTMLPVQLDGENGTFTIYSQNISISPPDPARNQSGNLGSMAFNETYGMSNLTASNVMMTFDSHFPSYYTAMTPYEKPMLRYKNFLSGPSLRELAFNPLLAPNNISDHMARLASAMTSVVRSSDRSNQMLAGDAFIKENYVSIRWEWLSFPLILLVFSLVFLIATIMKTSEDSAVGVWKTSAMPTLIYGLPKETQGQFTSSRTWSSGKGAPKKTRIKLLPNMGWRVSGQSHLSRSPRLPSGERVPRGWI